MRGWGGATLGREEMATAVLHGADDQGLAPKPASGVLGCHRTSACDRQTLVLMLCCCCLQVHSKCRQLKQQLMHMDRDLSKAGGGYDAADVDLHQRCPSKSSQGFCTGTLHKQFVSSLLTQLCGSLLCTHALHSAHPSTGLD